MRVGLNAKEYDTDLNYVVVYHLVLTGVFADKEIVKNEYVEDTS